MKLDHSSKSHNEGIPIKCPTLPLNRDVVYNILGFHLTRNEWIIIEWMNEWLLSEWLLNEWMSE